MLPTNAPFARQKWQAHRAVTMAIGAFLVAGVLAPAPVHAADLVVAYDQSQLLRLPRTVSSVIIGNPSIADVTVQGGNLLVVTGKTFGITNIIALDGERNIIQDQRVIVTRDEVRTVNLNKAGERQSYSCTPNCSPMLTIGDEKDYFSTISSHAQAKTRISEGTSGNSGTEGQ
ncbi:pilus assembly protein N-terminal domain-containing protein [Hyphomicrobium sp.]|uniref:pilus assembly protein N-terminal domain-containing protein n=1 Tax=Hyphomicrobium sp. TaxID=82 RepID=UPI002C56D5B1|nr:pilus assembly protein N-terminal domain-containing protein [Hyphomicrobium sp.]HRN87200.1 pilus assembly protein N-terminal domain-containing protein [Hyphomicrobium sp.]HRQ25822.1 pilus assembly protein N-terminal domain-containing protein [Hyphomicrobium sp.]